MTREEQIKAMEKMFEGMGIDIDKIKAMIPPITPVYNIIYGIEHRFIPSAFYNGKQKFIDDLFNNKDMLYNILNEAIESKKCLNPYNTTDFDVEKLESEDNTNIIKITCPTPKGPAEDALCKHIFLFYENDWSNQMLYCMEPNSMGKENEVFVCGWDRYGRHRNYAHELLTDSNDGLNRCKEIYKNNEEPKTIFTPRR